MAGYGNNVKRAVEPDLRRRPERPGSARIGAKVREIAHVPRQRAARGNNGRTPGRAWLYNAFMPEPLLQEIVSYIGFTEADQANVRSLAHIVQPHIPSIVRRFYQVLLKHPQARQVFQGGDEQITRQQELLAKWLREVFSEAVDGRYLKARFQIGITHVRVGLPPRYMLMGMEVVWQELGRVVRGTKVSGAEDKLASLHKLLMMELAVMVQSYQISDAERIRASERDAVAAQLIRAEHLAEIGQLAASLAHEIKNPLAGISGAIQIIGAAMRPDDPHREIVREILFQIGRLDFTVRDLLLYARPSPPVPQELKMDALLQRVLVLLREEPDVRRVRVEFEPKNGQAILHADEAQMEQLLMNLIINAAHASPEGATIQVSLHELNFYTRLVVRDSGHGMKPEVIERALEPFYTTKAKGTGLGLAICRRIAEAHGGTITLDSEVGKGTTVCVELPRVPTQGATRN